MANPLSNDSIVRHMADALPTHSKDDTGSDISSSYEAIALFSHACMTAVGFRILGFGEERKMESELAEISPRLSTKWNSGFGSYSLLYAHSQSSMQYVVKVDKLGSKAEIRGIGLGDERISRLEITAKDYISSAALPLRITMTAEGEDRSDLENKLKDVFISSSRITDLASLFKGTIIQKLMPGLHKEGYEESPNTAGASAARDARNEREEEANNRRNPPRDPLHHPDPRPAQPHPFNDPLAAAPRRPLPDGGFEPPGFDDEYDVFRGPNYQPHPLHGGYNGGRPPFGIGGDDLNPPGLGPHDPLRGSFVGGGAGPGSGGMHPTFDNPLFQGQGRGRGGFNPAPPGARYDPPYGGGAPQGGMGRPPNPFGGYGDNDFI